MDDWIDQNIRIVRLIPWCIGSLGIYLVFKHTYMFTRFRNVASIPNQLISSNQILSGRVMTSSRDGLEVWHVPLGYRLLRWKTHPPKESVKDNINSNTNSSNNNLISVKLAGVSLQSEVTQKWLETKLTNQMIRFVLLKKSEKEDSIECIIYKPFKYSFGAMSINEVLLKEGVASIKDSYDSHTSFMIKFSDREALAKRRGHGLWEGSEFESWGWWVWRKFKQLFIRKQ